MRSFPVLAAVALLASPALAQVTVTDATVRPPVHGQTSAIVTALLTSPVPDQLVAATSPIAAVMPHTVRRRTAGGELMAPAAIPLEARRPRRLSPYGYHLMMMGLRAPLVPGAKIPVTLRFAHAAPVTTTVTVVGR